LFTPLGETMHEKLETERLLLRPPLETDLAVMTALANDFGVLKNTATMPFPYTLADAQAFLTRAIERRAKGVGYSFAILCKANNAFIGGIGIHPEHEFELGYWLGRPFWGQGYATEAATRIVRFAFDELGAKKLTAGWYEGNEASSRVLEKLGFKPSGATMRESIARGASILSNQMVLTREDFARVENRHEQARH
jgi:RimJ/RimL family protein N-acetyltransferase